MELRGLFLSIAVVGATIHGVESQSILQVRQAWGPANGGLRLGISLVNTDGPSVAGAEFYVALQNIGDADFVINLGHMLANGRAMFPAAIHLIVTDPSGKTRELHFSDRRYPGVAGRLDDFTVALRTGSIYVIRARLDQYWSPATKEFGLKLAEGRHRIVARFEGQGAKAVGLDMQGVAHMDFWKGTLQSDPLQFEVSTNAVSK